MSQGATQHLRAAEATERRAGQQRLRPSTRSPQRLHCSGSSSTKSLLEHSLGSIELGAARFLPRAHEAGSIAAVRYSMSDLPENAALAQTSVSSPLSISVVWSSKTS